MDMAEVNQIIKRKFVSCGVCGAKAYTLDALAKLVLDHARLKFNTALGGAPHMFQPVKGEQ